MANGAPCADFGSPVQTADSEERKAAKAMKKEAATKVMKAMKKKAVMKRPAMKVMRAMKKKAALAGRPAGKSCT